MHVNQVLSLTPKNTLDLTIKGELDTGSMEDDDILDSGSTTSGNNDVLSDLVFMLEDVANIISCLYSLSAAMRQPAHRLQNYAEIDMSHYKFFDNQHVFEQFPNAEQFLIQRLGNANTQRRQYFKYRLLHHEKIAKGLDDAIAMDSVRGHVTDPIQGKSNRLKTQQQPRLSNSYLYSFDISHYVNCLKKSCGACKIYT